jgi:hypothetical protein
MSWAWVALLDAPPADADASAAAGEDGWLAAWLRHRKPVRHALRMDARLVDPHGDAAVVSLVLPPPGVRLKFDDVAVQQARRRVLAGPYPDGVSTLLSDASHFEGAISVIRGRDYDDPFSRVFPARLLHVGPGVLGAVAPPPCPTIERYGSEQPWPWDRFSAR